MERKRKGREREKRKIGKRDGWRKEGWTEGSTVGGERETMETRVANRGTG